MCKAADEEMQVEQETQVQPVAGNQTKSNGLHPGKECKRNRALGRTHGRTKERESAEVAEKEREKCTWPVISWKSRRDKAEKRVLKEVNHIKY